MVSESAPEFDTLLDRVRSVIPAESPQLYVVGGAVRDLLLSRPIHDMDFAVAEGVIPLARRVANALHAAFFLLDEERETARVILTGQDDQRIFLDFAILRGPDLETDLRSRDFTINAMALPVAPNQELIDPLGGAEDLRKGLIRPCSASAFHDDPVRVLRAVRFAAALNFRLLPATLQGIRQAAGELPRVSPERVRDELFHILGGARPESALRVMGHLHVLPVVFPELPDEKGVTQSPPHEFDVWTHTLGVVDHLQSVLDVLTLPFNPDAAANLALGQVSLRLGKFRQQVDAHLREQLIPGRSVRDLLFFSALYHDAGKPGTRQVEPDGRIRFFNHETLGAQIAMQRASALRLSNQEIEWLGKVIRNHLRPMLLAQADGNPSRRAVYRFFRDTGSAGIDVCLLSLADVLGTYGPALPQNVWEHHLEVVRTLLEGFWERPAEVVSPPPLVNGDDLMQQFSLQPGPQIGRLLELIREAQAAGEITGREDALNLARENLMD